MTSENIIKDRYISKIIADVIFKKLNIQNIQYKIYDDACLGIIPNERKEIFDISELVVKAHEIIFHDLYFTKKDDYNFSHALEVGYSGASYHYKDPQTKRDVEFWEELFNGNNKLENIVENLYDLIDQIWWVSNDNEIWDVYFGISKSENITWYATFGDNGLIDDLENLAQIYLALPFRSLKFESDLLRRFFFLYANTSCYYFWQSSSFYFSADARLKDFLDWTSFNNNRVQTFEEYKKYKNKYNFERLANDFWAPFFALCPSALFLWFFDFPSYSEAEFYVAWLLGLYFASKFLKTKNKIDRKKRKLEDKFKIKLRTFSKLICRMMSFAVEGKKILIEELLSTKITTQKFGLNTVSVPMRIKEILIRAKNEGEITIGDRI